MCSNRFLQKFGVIGAVIDSMYKPWTKWSASGYMTGPVGIWVAVCKCVYVHVAATHMFTQLVYMYERLKLN